MIDTCNQQVLGTEIPRGNSQRKRDRNMRMDNIAMLQETLRIMEQGSYEKNDRTVRLKLSRQQMEEAKVLLPQEVDEIKKLPSFAHAPAAESCAYSCVDADSYALARKCIQERASAPAETDRTAPREVLVLNFANPVNPGGGVRRGARAQEEDLCRKSSLLVSLEGDSARRYYEYNRTLGHYMGSDAVILTPKVEIIRDETGELLDETVIVAVLTCAAPMITYGKNGMNESEYEEMVYERVLGMLNCALYFGYQDFILGAWGCGAFGNNARVMSDLFHKALQKMEESRQEKGFFRRVDFAVLDRSRDQYNLQEFRRNFDESL